MHIGRERIRGKGVTNVISKGVRNPLGERIEVITRTTIINLRSYLHLTVGIKKLHKHENLWRVKGKAGARLKVALPLCVLTYDTLIVLGG